MMPKERETPCRADLSCLGLHPRLRGVGMGLALVRIRCPHLPRAGVNAWSRIHQHPPWLPQGYKYAECWYFMSISLSFLLTPCHIGKDVAGAFPGHLRDQSADDNSLKYRYPLLPN